MRMRQNAYLKRKNRKDKDENQEKGCRAKKSAPFIKLRIKNCTLFASVL